MSDKNLSEILKLLKNIELEVLRFMNSTQIDNFIKYGGENTYKKLRVFVKNKLAKYKEDVVHQRGLLEDENFYELVFSSLNRELCEYKKIVLKTEPRSLNYCSKKMDISTEKIELILKMFHDLSSENKNK